jgi:hypothetical protein
MVEFIGSWEAVSGANGAGLVRSDERRDLRGARHLEREQHIRVSTKLRSRFSTTDESQNAMSVSRRIS